LEAAHSRNRVSLSYSAGYVLRNMDKENISLYFGLNDSIVKLEL